MRGGVDGVENRWGGCRLWDMIDDEDDDDEVEDG